MTPSASPCFRVALWIFLAFTVLYVGATRGHFIGTDEIAVYQTARSLWDTGTLATGHINNTFRGRDGHFYGQYGAGQSVAALPLYGLGKMLGLALERAGLDDWVRTFAGPSIGTEPSRWGGDIEMFFANLFNCFVTALLCAVFFAFSVRLGASPRAAFIATTLLGLTSYVAPFSTGFLQHPTEALLLLWAFYLLYADSRSPSWATRGWAGVAVGVMLLVRVPALIGLPGLGLYLLWCVARRLPPPISWTTAGAVLVEVFPFATPVAAGLMLHVAVNYLKFETVWGKYNDEGFQTPLSHGLAGFLLSPGDSVFLFTPLLVLTPLILWRMWREHAAEAALILVLASSYLVFYGTYTAWHGLWSALGPRYLVPIVPLLLLPLAGWLEKSGRAAWLLVAPLGALGFWAQLVNVSVNFAFVYHHEAYPDFNPPFEFLFVPRMAPLLAHSSALLAGDYRVDMWLVNVYRSFGVARLIALALPLIAGLALCGWRLHRSLGDAFAGWESGMSPAFPCRPRVVTGALVLLCAATGFMLALDPSRGHSRTALPVPAPGKADAEGDLMQSGLDLLYQRQRPDAAAEQFRSVLARNPTHYGATFQLAMALDRAGRTMEARSMWQAVLRMAEHYNDAPTAATARARLAATP